MKKLNRIGIKEILEKRQNQINMKQTTDKNQQENQLIQRKQIDLNPLIQKLSYTKVDLPVKCQLLREEKLLLIQAISQRENISLNANTLLECMIVWKIPQEKIFSQNSRKNTIKSQLSQIKTYRNYYILKGTLEVYKKIKTHHNRDHLTASKKINLGDSQLFNDEKLGFTTEAGLNQNEHQSSNNSGINQQVKDESVTILEQMSGWGHLFGRKQEGAQHYFVAKKGIIVEIKNPEIENMLINPGGMDPHKKLQLITKFPIFKNISKKIQNIIPFIELKNYTRNEYIYHANQKPMAVYLIIKGQIVFQVKIERHKNNFSESVQNELNRHKPQNLSLQTEKLGAGGFFGEEQIISKSQKRNTDSICYSSDCSLLEIPLEKFQKLLAYSDFVQELKFSSEIKIKERKQKIKRSSGVRNQFSSLNQQLEQRQDIQNTDSHKQQEMGKTGKRKKPIQPIRMHGKIIRKFPEAKQAEEDIDFSMLKTNPDMYEATLKKFRKYTMKQPQKRKPEVDWKLKRIWKVLNLENVLREDTQVTSPEGKIFYESHRRLQNHVQQVKSIRPKTSSSTYRTKLQYIAYLQQFND